MSGTVDENGQPIQWTALYWRDGHRRSEECGDIVDALSYLIGGFADGFCVIDSIQDSAGKTVMGCRRILSFIDAYNDDRLEDAVMASADSNWHGHVVSCTTPETE